MPHIRFAGSAHDRAIELYAPTAETQSLSAEYAQQARLTGRGREEVAFGGLFKHGEDETMVAAA